MKIILSHQKPQCQHVESGQCNHCKNFRDHKVKRETWKPFEVLSSINFDTIITPFVIRRGAL